MAKALWFIQPLGHGLVITKNHCKSAKGMRCHVAAISGDVPSACNLFINLFIQGQYRRDFSSGFGKKKLLSFWRLCTDRLKVASTEEDRICTWDRKIHSNKHRTGDHAPMESVKIHLHLRINRESWFLVECPTRNPDPLLRMVAKLRNDGKTRMLQNSWG